MKPDCLDRLSTSASETLLNSKHAGSSGWWLEVARRGTPWIEPSGEGRCKVTFFWRDPQGSEFTSAYKRVWININCLTDHHQSSPPQSLQRLSGTDVWHWQIELKSDWRGSYSFIPSVEDRGVPDDAEDAFGRMFAVRSWWRSIFASASHDLLNPTRSWPGAKGHALSGVSLPDAPAQSAWQDFDCYATSSGLCMPAPPAKIQRYQWNSSRLGNERKVWIYTTGESENPASRPLAILLDGQFWSQKMPIWEPLMQQTAQGKLPEAVYVLIEAIDTQHRSEELTCNPDFWLAVQEELLPEVASLAPHTRSPSKTVVAGQSFGGLSSLYAALHWPQRFGCVLAQSGSFWWPRRDMLQRHTVPEDACWLPKQVQQGLGQNAALRIFMEAGRHEGLIHQVNDSLVNILQDSNHSVHYRIVEGGHDALCWRGGLVDGLQALWAEKFIARQPSLSFSLNSIKSGAQHGKA
ncbi:enterochelin esterase [Rouxiella badensis]|uniref:enterochelin esterase n=1 Tax=Rouxiella badensis TaxID=1646377 RepID=UPI001D15735A|nr:enterochelin esterase [Rouxiella badensis]MCC3705381.1 enterochelin esterase [Rouxiella badensis]